MPQLSSTGANEFDLAIYARENGLITGDEFLTIMSAAIRIKYAPSGVYDAELTKYYALLNKHLLEPKSDD